MKITSLENKDLLGKKWRELTGEQQLAILSVSNVWEDVKEGLCIVDIDEDLAIKGTVINNDTEYEFDREIYIEDEEVFYNPLG